MSVYTAEEIEKLTIIEMWPLRRCSMCSVVLFYSFDGDDVFYHSGCNCVVDTSGINESSWQEVADTVNRQKPEVQATMIAELKGEVKANPQ